MQTIIRFFKTIFLVDLLKGMWLTMKYTPQPAFTFQYPAERRPTAPRFRGVLRLQVEPASGAQTPRHAPTTSSPSAGTGSRA